MNSAGASKAAARRMEHQYHRGKVEAQIEAALSSWLSMDQASWSLAWQLCNMPSRQHNFNPSAQVQRRPPSHVLSMAGLPRSLVQPWRSGYSFSLAEDKLSKHKTLQLTENFLTHKTSC